MEPRRLRLLWRAALRFVGSTVAVLWLFQFYGWHRYNAQLEELNAVLIPAVNESTRYLKLSAVQGAEVDCDISIDDLLAHTVEIESLVELRDSLLAVPDICTQMTGLAAATEVLSAVVEALDTGELSPETLASYLELGQGVGWYPLMAQWVADICVENPPALTMDWATNWIAGGYVGALCVSSMKGVYDAIEKPAVDDSTALIIRDGCQDAFLGARWHCRLLVEHDGLVAVVEIRRAYLLALQRTRQRVEAAMEAEGKLDRQKPRLRNSEEVAV